MKVSALKLNPGNPRQIKGERLDLLKRSITEFEQMMSIRPIIVDESNTVLGGNMRLQAIKTLGRKEIPDEWVKQVNDLTEEQKREFIIKDNAGFGEWDWDLLANDWDDLPLSDWGVDIPDFGDEIEAETVDAEPQIDRAAELNEKWKVETGDLWQIGEHRLLCGDSTNRADAARLMQGAKAALVHADPPYGMGKEKDGIANDNLYREKLDAFQLAWWKAFRPHVEDNVSAYIWGQAEDLWRLWYCGGLKDSERMTFRNEIVWDKGDAGAGGISHQGAEGLRLFPNATERCLFFMLGEQGFNNNADNYWEGFEPIRAYLDGEREKAGWSNKTVAAFFGFHPRMADHWFSKSQWSFPTKEQYERLQSEASGQAFKREYDELKREHDELKREHDELKQEFYATRAYFDNTHDNMTDVWQFPRVTGDDRHDHATPKPVEMLQRCIKSSAPKGAAVVEPFAGSGTTLVACQNLNRKCYAVEISPNYCAVILERMQTAFPELEIKRIESAKEHNA